MTLSNEEVKKVAVLARLELDEQEIDAQSKSFNDLLERFTALQTLDVAGVEPTAHPIPVVNVFRDDNIQPSLDRRDVIVNAPQSDAGCFVVPRILEA
jgi:aspartyl-tRNA(Asn)/glutamyl-tRNA(Gln) amidotransferase subunit C